MKLLRLCIVSALMLVIAASAEAKIAVYEPTGWAQSSLAKVSYRLNTNTAYVIVTIYPSDANGNPTGPPVQSETYYNEPRGYREHFYYGLTTNRYVAVIEAGGVNEAAWRPQAGIYKIDQPTVEYSPPNPTVPDIEGWYGIGVNTRAASPYFGYVYSPHKSYQDIYVYRGDGSFFRTMNDTGVYWGASAPWDVCVAGDDYFYVGDRSSRLVYCCKPDGSGIESVSPPVTYSRALFARTDVSGVTYVYVTGGYGDVYQVTLQANHQTWGTPVIIASLGGLSDDNFKIGGLWVNSAGNTMYVCYDGKLHKLVKSGNVWVAAGSPWPVSIPSCFDVDMAHDGSKLWVSANRAYSPTASYPIYQVNPTTGAVTTVTYGTVTWGHMVKTDAVGNVAFTYGKSTPTWGQYYWAMFTEPGTSSYNTRTNTFNTTGDHLPVMTFYTMEPASVPGDNSTTATMTGWVYDGAGWADAQQIRVDLDAVGITEDVISTTRVSAPSDPTGRTAIFTVPGLKAAVGARVAVHNLPVVITDSSGSVSDSVQLRVTGTNVTFTVKHNETNRPIANAVVRATGGTPGLPGYPFEYTSALTNSSGVAVLELSQGTYQVQAVKSGYGSLPAVEVVVGGSPSSSTLYLRACTVAEARALADSTQCNVKGVVFAATSGPYTSPNPPAVKGLAERKDLTSYCYQWYVCDANNPNNGILMVFPIPEDPFSYQMDDPGDPTTYVGPRPKVGDTVRVTGMLATPSGHERRIRLDTALTYASDVYCNYGNIGGLPAMPAGITIPEFAHASISQHPSWGKYAILMGAVVLKNVPNGEPSGTSYGDPVPYSVIADMSGNMAELVIETPLTTGVTAWPEPGAVYMFRGPIGRRARYGNGCIRVRTASDIMLSEAAGPRGAAISSVREMPDGSYVNVEGIVSGVWATCFYIQSSDRSGGIRVNMDAGYYVKRGDVAQVQGILGVTDGERSIAPTMPPVVHETVTPPVPLGVRNRDLGGNSPSPENPGVTDGRGPLNVGLLVKTTGKVNYTNTGYFYIHDGSNRSDAPLDDGSGHYGVRITSNTVVNVGERLEVTGVSTTDTWNVPGRNIPTIMPRDVNDIVRNPALSAVSSPGGTVTAGWNLIAVPAIPSDPSPDVVLSGIPIDGALYRWEASVGGLYTYDTWTPDIFGGILLGDGYWMQSPSAKTISYQGRYQTDDQWITLPTAGWTLIGHPFTQSREWENVKVANGIYVLGMSDASHLEGWMNSLGYWWDSGSQGLYDFGLPEDWVAQTALAPWHGYWVQSNVDDLALIVPAN
ncbi:MAG: carboxypeptidase regulatory-like domain-containing protein [Armatimonadetes bacterium]|nr:carboxypeptidase regulatory-like domain-containing protein [Armatimonadota bacterium]